MVASQRHVLPELQERGALLPDRDATGLERDVLTILRDDLRVDVQLGAPIGTKVQVVDPPDLPVELAAADRTLQVKVESRTLGWRRLASEHGVGREAVLHGLRDLRPVLIDQLSRDRLIGVIRAKADLLSGRISDTHSRSSHRACTLPPGETLHVESQRSAGGKAARASLELRRRAL